MRRGHLFYTVLVTGALVALTLAGCGMADNANPKPEAYVELGQYKGLEYVIPSGEPTEEELADELLYFASSFPTDVVVTEGVVDENDVVNIDYEATLNGKPFEGSSVKDLEVDLGYGDDIIDSSDSGFGFEDQLYGAIIGDTISFDLTLPEDHERDELAGKTIHFEVTVNSVKREGIPEITDEFISNVSEGQYKTVDDYKTALREEMTKEGNELEHSLVYSNLLDMATENAVIIKDLPDEYVKNKLRRLLDNSASLATQYGVDFNTFVSRYLNMSVEEYYAQADDYALKAAKQSLVVALIAKAEGITVSEDELNAAINTYVEQYEYESAEAFREATDMDDFEEYILISKIQDFLYENAVITEEAAE